MWKEIHETFKVEEHSWMIRATRSRSIRPNKLQNQTRSPKPPTSVGVRRISAGCKRVQSGCKPTVVAANRREPSRPVPLRFPLRLGPPKSFEIRPTKEPKSTWAFWRGADGGLTRWGAKEFQGQVKNEQMFLYCFPN